MPGVPLVTTKDLIAARPSFLSKVAHTTTASARSPEVTKIFSPFKIYSLSTLVAVVRIAAESEPQLGSVIAMAAQTPLKRCNCSSLATAAIAELPKPWRGILSNKPVSP